MTAYPGLRFPQPYDNPCGGCQCQAVSPGSAIRFPSKEKKGALTEPMTLRYANVSSISKICNMHTGKGKRTYCTFLVEYMRLCIFFNVCMYSVTYLKSS